MGCNCKNKVDAINQKYGDGGKSENTKVNPLLMISWVTRRSMCC